MVLYNQHKNDKRYRFQFVMNDDHLEFLEKMSEHLKKMEQRLEDVTTPWDCKVYSDFFMMTMSEEERKVLSGVVGTHIETRLNRKLSRKEFDFAVSRFTNFTA